MAPIPPDGVFVPVPTFFKSATKSSLQPAVDVETQVAHSVHLAKSGITGLVLLGSTGEAIHLSRSERFDLVSGVRKGLDAAGFKDYPIMAGVLVNSVDEVLEWLNDFQKAGAQWGKSQFMNSHIGRRCLQRQGWYWLQDILVPLQLRTTW